MLVAVTCVFILVGWVGWRATDAMVKELGPLQTWHVGSVVRTELLSNLEEKRDLIVGFGKYPVFVPTSSTTLRKQTLVVTDQWQFLVDGQWLLAKGTQLEVRERTAGPQLCVKAEQACHRFHQSSQLQVESANSSQLPNRR